LNFYTIVIYPRKLHMKCWWNWHLVLLSSTCLRTAFTGADPKIIKLQSSCQYLFALLGSACIKLPVKCWFSWPLEIIFEGKYKREFLILLYAYINGIIVFFINGIICFFTRSGKSTSCYDILWPDKSNKYPWETIFIHIHFYSFYQLHSPLPLKLSVQLSLQMRSYIINKFCNLNHFCLHNMTWEDIVIPKLTSIL